MAEKKKKTPAEMATESFDKSSGTSWFQRKLLDPAQRVMRMKALDAESEKAPDYEKDKKKKRHSY